MARMRWMVAVVVLLVAGGAAAAVSSEVSQGGPYACGGVTFSAPFKFFASSDLRVVVTSPAGAESTLALGTDYTVAGAGGASGGTVTLVASSRCPSASTLVVMRIVPFTQPYVFSPQGPLSVSTLGSALDRVVMQTQQLDRKVTGEHAAWSAADALLRNDLTAETAARIAADLELWTAAGSGGGGGGGGPGDSSAVTAYGTTVPRTLTLRFGDRPMLTDSSSLAAAVTAIPANGGTVTVPAGTFSFSATQSLKDFMQLDGVSTHGSRFNFTGTGKAFDFQSVVDSNTRLSGFTLHGNASATESCIEWRNSPLVSSSASFLQLRDLYVDNCPAGEAALHLLGIKPTSGEGNVYGALLFNAHFDSNMGHGIWLDSQSAGGAAGTALTNIWASSASGNQGYGLFLDTSNAPASRHGIANVFGSLLQGNAQAAIKASSVGGLNLIGSYFEQTGGQPQISAGAAVHPNGPMLILGNSLGNSPSPAPAYNVDLGANGADWGSIAVISQANTINVLPTHSVYNISRLSGAILGPDVTSATGNTYVNWDEAWGYAMVQVFDRNAGTWSFSSDGTYSEQPKIGFGVKNTSIAAQLHVKGRIPPQVATAGTNAFPILTVEGPKGGDTSGAFTAGKGSSVTLTAGNGGTGVAGSTTGAGGDVTITSGLAGTGTGGATIGATGKILLNTSVGQGTAMKHGRVTTGAVGNGARAAVTLTWGGTAFADTSYTVTCSVSDTSAAGAALSLERVTAQTSSSVTVQVYNAGAGSLTGTVHCMAMHD